MLDWDSGVPLLRLDLPFIDILRYSPAKPSRRKLIGNFSVLILVCFQEVEVNPVDRMGGTPAEVIIIQHAPQWIDMRHEWRTQSALSDFVIGYQRGVSLIA